MKTLLFIIMLITSLFSDDSSIQSTSAQNVQHSTLFGPIKDLDVSTDGKFVVMGSLGGNIFIQNLEDKNNIAVLHTTLDDITSLDLSKDMTTIIAGDLKGQVEVWNLLKKTLIRKLNGHSREITSISISDDNTRIVTVSNHESMKIWNMQTGALIATPISDKPDDDFQLRKDFAKLNGSNVFSLNGAKRVVDVFDSKTGEARAKIPIFDENMDYVPRNARFMMDQSIIFSADNKNIILSTLDEDRVCKDCKKPSNNNICIKSFDIDTHALKYKIPVKGRFPLLTLSKDGKYGILIEQYTKKIKVTPLKESILLSSEIHREIALLKRFDINSGEIIDTYVLSDESTFDRQARLIGFAYIHEISEGKYLTLAKDGGIDTWDINQTINDTSNSDIDSGSIKKLQKNTLFGSSRTMALSSNGKFVVMGSLGGNIFIMNLEDKNNISILHTTLDDITSIDLSKDMTTLIAGDLKGQVEVWNLPKKTLVRKIDGHTQEITSVSISDDNSRIMTASKHETTKLWNLETGQLIITPISLELPIDYDPSAYLSTSLSSTNAFSFMDAQRWIDIFDAKSGKSKGKVTIFDEMLDPNHRYITTHLPFINHRAIDFTADGKNVILSTMDEDTLCKDCEKSIEMCIKTFDISSNALNYKIPLRGSLPALTLSKDGKHGIFIDQYIDKVNGKSKMIALVKRFEIDSGKIVDSHVLLDEWTTNHQVRLNRFTYVREISEGKYLTLAQDGGIDIWDLKNLNITNKGK